jgi:hypothetical protein
MYCMRSGCTHLSTWITAQSKQRFRAMATKQGFSESALLKRLIEQLLALAAGDEATVTPAPAELRDARMTIRLRADDRLLLRERAAARGMPGATYLSVLTRTHLHSLAPLPDHELVLLGRSVSELNSIGRNLNLIARSIQQGTSPGGVSREELREPCSRLVKPSATASGPLLPQRTLNLKIGGGKPLLGLASYGRRGPGREGHLSASEIEHIARTIGRAPEVMVKISGGGKSKGAAVAHLRYIDRDGTLEIETDSGDVLKGNDVAGDLAADWDLDTVAAQARRPYGGRPGRKPAKLVHNVVLSMPAGTSPAKLLTATRAFAREQFALKHRYAMVLHTDQEHPHVHLAIKAMSEHGQRLNIRKSTLRDWRRQFAHHLRAEGIAANATERAVRGENRTPLLDGIYRAARRRMSIRMRQRVEHVASHLQRGGLPAESGKAKLLQTRAVVADGWQTVADALVAEGNRKLAE